MRRGLLAVLAAAVAAATVAGLAQGRTAAAAYRIAVVVAARQDEIWSIDANGRDAHLLVRQSRRPDRLPLFAAWSPDGRKIAYTCGGATARYLTNLCLMNADGSGSRRLLRSAALLDGPLVWTPDGLQVAAFCWTKGLNICLLGTGSPYVVPLRSAPIAARLRTFWFSPDGKWLLGLCGTPAQVCVGGSVAGAVRTVGSTAGALPVGWRPGTSQAVLASAAGKLLSVDAASGKVKPLDGTLSQVFLFAPRDKRGEIVARAAAVSLLPRDGRAATTLWRPRAGTTVVRALLQPH